MSCPRATRLATLALLLLSAACGSSHTGDPATTEFAPKLNVSLANMERRESGLYVQDVQVGTGAVAAFGNIPSVVYSLWLPDGELMDTNVGAGAFEFQLGMGQVIRGWDEGLVGMRVGGKRRLVIPSALGYGDEGSGPIPGKAVLVFEVELRSLR